MSFTINHREPCHWSQRLHRRSGLSVVTVEKRCTSWSYRI
ncbi:unnamed protein product, partial [Brassica oleracea]